MKLLVTAFFMILAMLPAPGMAGTLDIDVTGVLGPVLQGSDAIRLSGATFTATGAIDASAVPVGISGGAYVYDLSGDVQITLGLLTLTGYNPELILSAPSSGPDTAILDFSVTEYGFAPVVEAFLTLPPGTLNGPGVQPFSASVSEPDSYVTYALPGEEDVIYASLGITGNASMGGTPPASAPEPGTVGLLAAGLALAIAMKNMKKKGHSR
jgi:hypothetical protein